MKFIRLCCLLKIIPFLENVVLKILGNFELFTDSFIFMFTILIYICRINYGFCEKNMYT